MAMIDISIFENYLELGKQHLQCTDEVEKWARYKQLKRGSVPPTKAQSGPNQYINSSQSVYPGITIITQSSYMVHLKMLKVTFNVNTSNFFLSVLFKPDNIGLDKLTNQTFHEIESFIF